MTADESNPLRQALTSLGALSETLSEVALLPGLLEQLRVALHGTTDRRTALRLLLLLDAQVTTALMPDVVAAGMGHRDAVLAREVLGRLPARVVRAHIPIIVSERVRSADDDDMRRLAELLAHLGLDAALADLAQAAQASTDPEIREVGRDFGVT